MAKKIIITTEQYHRLVNSMTIDANKAQDVLKESAFDNIKSVISSFSSKKSFKDDPSTITALGNKVIKDLDADIRKTDPEFPNNRSNTDFLNTVLRIGAVYDTVFGAVYLDPTEEGYLTATAANVIIADLRNYVKRIIDVNLKSIYKRLHEADYPTQVSANLQSKGDATQQNGGSQVAGAINGGSKNSRGGILMDLFKSMVNVDPATIPNRPVAPTAPVTPSGTTRNAPRGTFDPAFEDTYRSILSLFKFIINNRKLLGVRSGKNVGTGTAINNMMKAGDEMTYRGKKVIVVKRDSAPGRTQVRNPNKKSIYAVKTSELKRIPVGQPIQEGKYIRDDKSVEYLEKVTSPDKVKLFESLLNYADNIRTKIKGLKPTGIDTRFDKILARFGSNPIMLTDFNKMFNVPSDNIAELNSFKTFIDEVLLSVYSGNLDRLSKFGGGINKMNEAPSYNIAEPNKAFLADAQDRRAFKKNLIKFLSILFELFMHLYSLKHPKKIKP